MEPSKKRRLNNANETLLKPFASPLKRSAQPKLSQEKQELRSGHLLKTSSQAIVSQESLSSEDAPSSSSSQNAPPVTQSTPVCSRYARTTSGPIRRSLTPAQQKTKAVRRDIDVLQQAMDIQEANSAEKLERLTIKWRLTAQQAADMLFEDAKSRVDINGGIQNSFEHDRSFARHATANPMVSRHSNSGRNEEAYEGAQDEALSGLELRQRACDDADESAEDDEKRSFTISSMLQSLNIELDVIGYDSDAQCWL